MTSSLPLPFSYVDVAAVTRANWTPVEIRTLGDGSEVIVCSPGGVFFKRSECINKERGHKAIPEMIDIVRAAGLNVGYGIGVNGPLVPGSVIIAVPWTDTAVSTTKFVEYIEKVTGYVRQSSGIVDMPGGRKYVALVRPGAQKHHALYMSITPNSRKDTDEHDA